MSEDKNSTEIPVDQSNEEVAPEDTDALEDMLAALTQETEEDTEEVSVEDAEDVAAIEERTDEPTAPIEEVVEEVAEVIPEYLEGMEVKDDVVVIGEVELKRELAEDAVNWAEKRGKADWMKRPVSDMSEDEALAYRTIQSLHDKHVSTQKVEEAPVLTQAQYQEAKQNPAFQKFLEALDGMDSKPVESTPPVTEVKEAKYKKAIGALADSLQEGDIDREQFVKLYEDYTNGVREELESGVEAKARSIVRQELAENRQSNEIQARQDSVVEELKSLAEVEGDELVNWALTPIPGDAEGRSDLGVMLSMIDPMTKQPMTVTDAWRYHKMAEGKTDVPKSDKRYTFLAQPQPSSVIKDEPDLTDDQMNEMSELDVALKNLEKV